MHKSLTSKHFTMLSPIMGYVQTDSVDSPFSTHSLRKFYFEEFLADKFVKDDLFKTCLFPVFDFNTGEVRLCYCLQVYFETEQEMSYNESLFFHGHPDKETALKDIVSPSCFIDYGKITDDFFLWSLPFSVLSDRDNDNDDAFVYKYKYTYKYTYTYEQKPLKRLK